MGDPCFEGCHPDENATNSTGCTQDFCKGLGKIGCDGELCALMGSGNTSHCMSCEPMTKTDPCFNACNYEQNKTGCTATQCAALGHIGCGGEACSVMGNG